MKIKARDLMTKNVQTVDLRTPVYQVMNIMINEEISGLPVVDEANNLVGIITESNLIECLVTGENLDDVLAGSLLTSEVNTFSPDDDIMLLVNDFKTHGHRMLPIIEHNQVIGVVSRRDILRMIENSL